jgi:tRNA A37 methylthiotransferase MiaB
MRVCIISSIGSQTYQGKYIERKPIWSSFWNLCVFHDQEPIDVVDFYHLKKDPNFKINSSNDRHIYTNGILLFNRLRTITDDIILYNSLNDCISLDGIDVAIISTNYVTTNWEDRLVTLLEQFKVVGIKCIIGGIGIKKLYNNNEKSFRKIVDLIDGCVLISDNGLTKLLWALKNISDIDNKDIVCDDEYEISYKDFSLNYLDRQFHSKHTAFLTQKGCVFNCAFCSYKEKYKKHSFFDLEEIKKTLIELTTSNRNTLKHLRIVDETFNISVDRAIHICNFFKTQNFEFHWSCFLRADNITQELARALHDSKCDLVSIGVESGSPLMQKIMNKNVDLSKLKRSINMLKNEGIKVNISLLVGFFGEDENTINDTILYIKDCKPDFARINLWYPSRNINNEALFEQYRFTNYNNTWKHQTLSEEQAVEYAKKIYLVDSETIFLPPFSSIFDQWPVLASFDLSANEIVDVFREYYYISKNSA